MLSMGTFVVIIFMMIIGLPCLFVGFLFWKRSQNQKRAHGALLCVFKGIDKWWVRLLQVEDGQIKKPEGKYLKKSEIGKKIAWPESGYIAPMSTLPILWPIGAMSILQVPVGLAIYKVGNPKPQPVDDSFPAVTADTISAIHENKVVQDVFRNIQREASLQLGGGKKGKGEGLKANLMEYIVVGGVIGSAVLVFICLTKITSLEQELIQIKQLLGG